MNWIRDIENRLKMRQKQKRFGFRIFQVLVCLVIVLFVLHLFVKDKITVIYEAPTADIYDC